MSAAEAIGYALGLAIARGALAGVDFRARRGVLGEACVLPGCGQPRAQMGGRKAGRFCAAHHGRYYRGRSLEPVCRCGRPLGRWTQVCAECRKPEREINAANYARLRADPVRWAERKRKMREQAAARKRKAREAGAPLVGAIVAVRLLGGGR